MNSCLVDANVWVGILVEEHVHHVASRRWFDLLAPAEAGLCRLVQLGVLRALSNHAIMRAGALPPREAWSPVAHLLEDERVEFLPEPPDLESVLPDLLRYPIPTGKLINDAYLAAFAINSNRELVTWDRGFQQFRGLRVKLLEA